MVKTGNVEEHDKNYLGFKIFGWYLESIRKLMKTGA